MVAGATGAPARRRPGPGQPGFTPKGDLVKALPEIAVADGATEPTVSATEQALNGSSALLRAVVGGYLRLIDYQLLRIQRVITKGTDHLTDDPLSEMLQKLTAGRGELANTMQTLDPFMALTHLKINISRFNSDRVQSRLDPVYTTQRPAPDPAQVQPETQEMQKRLGFVISELEKSVAAQIDSTRLQASLAANFPPDAVKSAAATLTKIVSNLRSMYNKNLFPADYTLPSNMPAVQSVAGGQRVIKIHPTGFLERTLSEAQATLAHEGSHALDPNIVDYVYRNSGLHPLLPSALALGNAAGYEQVVAEVTGQDPVSVPAGQMPRVRTALAYATVRITQAWVAAHAAAGQTRADLAGPREYALARIAGAPLGVGDGKTIRTPLPIDVKLIADIYDAISVLLKTVSDLRIGGQQRGPVTISRAGQKDPFTLRPGEHSEQASLEELQGLIIEQLAAAAVQTGNTSHLTAGEIQQIISSLPDLISKTDQAKLKILEDAAKPTTEKKKV